MYGPLARITYTRLPWWWALPVMLVVLAALSPALAGEADEPFARTDDPAPADAPLRIAGWQLVPLEQSLRQLQQRDAGMPRMLPLAVLPLPRSAWWLGWPPRAAAGHASSCAGRCRWTAAHRAHRWSNAERAPPDQQAREATRRRPASPGHRTPVSYPQRRGHPFPDAGAFR